MCNGYLLQLFISDFIASEKCHFTIKVHYNMQFIYIHCYTICLNEAFEKCYYHLIHRIEPKCVRKNFLKTKTSQTKGEEKKVPIGFEIGEANEREREGERDRQTTLPPFDLYISDSGVSFQAHVNYNLLCVFLCVLPSLYRLHIHTFANSNNR